MNWCLDCAVGLVKPAVGLEGVAGGWVFLVPSQIFFHLKPKAIVGPFGYKQHSRPSKSSERKTRLVCSCDWNNQPMVEIKGAWIELGVDLVREVVHFTA